jgi:hypothetical protein
MEKGLVLVIEFEYRALFLWRRGRENLNSFALLLISLSEVS